MPGWSRREAALGHAGIDLGRDVADQEVGLGALARRWTAPARRRSRGCRPGAPPPTSRRGTPAVVDRPGADVDLGHLAVDLVPVDVDVVDAVVVPDALELLERLPRQAGRRVPQPDVADGRPRRRPGSTSSRSVGRREALHGRRRSGRAPRAWPRCCGRCRAAPWPTRWADLEPLHVLRVDAAGDHGHEHPQADGQHRQGPAPPEDVDDEQHGRRPAR